MRWITRRSAHVDRTACPWLIVKFIDPDAEFVFVAPDIDPATLDGHTFDMRGAEYAHEDGKCTFQVMLERHDLSGDAALMELGRIVGDADVPPGRMRRHESAGLDAIMRGFQLTRAVRERIAAARGRSETLEPRQRLGSYRPVRRWSSECRRNNLGLWLGE